MDKVAYRSVGEWSLRSERAYDNPFSDVIVDAAFTAPSGKVVLAVRPERIALSRPGDGGLPGTVTNIVYHGTDTIYHFDLPDGTAMRARSQNSSPDALPVGIGDAIGWSADPRSVSVLEDG